MSERKKTHNGRDTSGNFKVKLGDVDEIRTDPEGTDVIRDDVRLGGAIADTGPDAGKRGERIGDLVESNRDDVTKLTGTGQPPKK